MKVDWFTVIAQILNFLILVWLMKHFLYKPILNAIDEREKKIAEALSDADEKRKEAKEAHEIYQKKNEAFEQMREDLIKQTKDEIEKERQNLLKEAHQAADELTRKREVRLQNDAIQLSGTISSWTKKEVFDIARKTLRDLGAISLEERLTAVFIQHLEDMNGIAKEIFLKAIEATTTPAELRSAFELPEDQKNQIEEALSKHFMPDIPLKYEVAPHLISGIELSVNGRKISWNIEDYLTTLEEGVARIINVKDLADAKAEYSGPGH